MKIHKPQSFNQTINSNILEEMSLMRSLNVA